jgi:hypothetical protein
MNGAGVGDLCWVEAGDLLGFGSSADGIRIEISW